MRGYSRGTQAVRTHRYAREARADDADVPGAVGAIDTHEPTAVTGLHTTRRAKLAPAPSQKDPGGTPVRYEYRAPRRYRRWGTPGTRSTRRAALRGAPAVRRCRTGAAVRGYSQGTQAVRTHRYAREGRADDADVAGAAAGDTHEPPAAVTGLHTTRRAKLAPALTQKVPRRYPGAP